MVPGGGRRHRYGGQVTAEREHTGLAAFARPLPILAFVSLVGFSPVLNYSAWTVKAVALLLILGWGLAAVPQLWRVDRLCAGAALAFFAIAAVSTARSPQPALAV